MFNIKQDYLKDMAIVTDYACLVLKTSNENLFFLRLLVFLYRPTSF